MKYLFLFLSFACLIKVNTFARKPAVEPILGVSIEEYKEVPPSKAKGYNFSRTPNSDQNDQKKTETQSEVRVHDQNEIKSQSQTSLEDNKSKNLLFVLLVALPIFASFVSYLRFKVNDQDLDNNVVELRSKKEKSHNDVKKAS